MAGAIYDAIARSKIRVYATATSVVSFFFIFLQTMPQSGQQRSLIDLLLEQALQVVLEDCSVHRDGRVQIPFHDRHRRTWDDLLLTTADAVDRIALLFQIQHHGLHSGFVQHVARCVLPFLQRHRERRIPRFAQARFDTPVSDAVKQALLTEEQKFQQRLC